MIKFNRSGFDGIFSTTHNFICKQISEDAGDLEKLPVGDGEDTTFDVAEV